MEIILQYWQPALFSLLIGILFVGLARKFFPKWGLMDRPHKYGLKRDPIPYYGGLTMFLAFMIAVFLFVPLTTELVGLLVAATLIVIVGFLDDLFNLSPFLRLLAQFMAAVILVFFGIGILSINIPFLGVLDFSHPLIGGIMIFSAIFTIFWVMAVLNTMNFIDGISGLSSGVAFIAGLTIFFLSVNPSLHENPAAQHGVALVALIVAMVALAFLLFDFPTPKILMGDTGSTFLGFMIATLAIFSGGKVATAFLVLGIPILDMIWVVLRRIFSGQKFWQGDLKHLHHRLLDLGFSQRQVVLMYLTVTAVFGFSAVMLVSSQQKFFMLIALAVLMLLLAAALVFIPRKK